MAQAEAAYADRKMLFTFDDTTETIVVPAGVRDGGTFMHKVTPSKK